MWEHFKSPQHNAQQTRIKVASTLKANQNAGVPRTGAGSYDDISELPDEASIPNTLGTRTREAERNALEELIHQRASGISDNALQTYANVYNEAIKGHLRTLENEIRATMEAQEYATGKLDIDHRIGQIVLNQLTQCMDDPVIAQAIKLDLINELTDFSSAIQLDILAIENRIAEAQSLKEATIQEPSQMYLQTQLKLAINKYKTEVIRPRVSQQVRKKNKPPLPDIDTIPLFEFFALPIVQAIVNPSHMEAEIDEMVVLPLERKHEEVYQEYLDMRDKKNNSFSIIQAAIMEKNQLAKISAYCSAISVIIKYLQDSVVNCLSALSKNISNVYAVLNRNISMNLYANESISIISPASISTRNIVGIMWNVTRKFSTVTPSTLTHAYMDILTDFLTGEDFEREPRLFLTRVNDKHSIWKRDNLFNLLSEDLLWSLWTLRGIPDTPSATEFRKLMYKAFYEALEKYPIANTSETTSTSSASIGSSNTRVHNLKPNDLPIYSLILKRADDYFNNEMVLDTITTDQRSPNKALVASNLPTAKPNPFDGFKPLPAAKFNTPIGPEKKYFISYRGRKYVYTATTEVCPKCSTDHQRCKPACSRLQCTKCQKFGHHNNHCHQL